jgi:predicted transposase YdaD
MGKRKKNSPTQEQQQPYDTLLKSLFEGQEEQVLPYFLDGAVYLETLDIEVMRTILRVDRVYKVLYNGQEHILHLEFETNSNPGMAARLLDYHAYLYRKYELPVISTIVYPFRTEVAVSPLEEVSHGRPILIFHFQVLKLWEMSAEKYVRSHAFALYALLPAMGDANVQLLVKAIREMIQYYQEDKATLGRELLWLGIVLRRADILPLEDKRVIEEILSMYDDLMEKDPKIQQFRAKTLAEGEAKGEAKGRRKELQRVILALVQKRFPALSEQVRQKIKRVKTVDELSNLCLDLIGVTDEPAARKLLTS